MTGTYRTTLTGAFPRPEALVQATRDLDRGRIPPEAAEAAFQVAETEVRRVEKDLGLDTVTGGYLRWSDLFRPFTQIWSGVSAGPLTRFFETNTFYRQPVLERPPTPGKGALAGWVPRGKDARAVLPGPFTFAALSDIRYAPKGSASAILDLATALAAEISSLGADRPGHVQFQEPMLAYAPPKGDLAEVVEAYRRLATASVGSVTSVWTYFADAGPVLDQAARLPVDVVGFDLFESTIPQGIRLGSKGIGLGCLDPTTTIAEEPTAVAQLVRAAEAALRPNVVWLGPNPPLDLLPFESAVAKLQLLPRLREALGR
jgi:5-methyltetrahydropteroyltriglutamate--homocysteine methyltransferase